MFLPLLAAPINGSIAITQPDGSVIYTTQPNQFLSAQSDFVTDVPTSFGTVTVNSIIGADRFYTAGYTGSSAVMANIEAGTIWNGHETLGHVTSFTFDASAGGQIGQVDRHATWVGQASRWAAARSGPITVRGSRPTRRCDRGHCDGLGWHCLYLVVWRNFRLLVLPLYLGRHRVWRGGCYQQQLGIHRCHWPRTPSRWATTAWRLPTHEPRSLRRRATAVRAPIPSTGPPRDTTAFPLAPSRTTATTDTLPSPISG